MGLGKRAVCFGNLVVSLAFLLGLRFVLDDTGFVKLLQLVTNLNVVLTPSLVRIHLVLMQSRHHHFII